jgi:hypothetical protein
MNALVLCAFLGLGAGAGALHYALLARDAHDLANGGAALPILGRRLGRFALSGALFVLAAGSGLIALIAAAAGFMALRQWSIARFGTVR